MAYDESPHSSRRTEPMRNAAALRPGQAASRLATISTAGTTRAMATRAAGGTYCNGV